MMRSNLFLIACAVSMWFVSSAANAIGATKAKAELMQACLATSNDKYTLYKECIGKVTKSCDANYDAFEVVMEDIAVGPPYRDCIERESIWWAEIFKEYSLKLQNETRQTTTDKSIIDTLASDIKNLEKRPHNECDYETVRWGYREGDLVQIQGIDDQFRCIRDINAENAITVYLWLKAQY